MTGQDRSEEVRTGWDSSRNVLPELSQETKIKLPELAQGTEKALPELAQE